MKNLLKNYDRQKGYWMNEKSLQAFKESAIRKARTNLKDFTTYTTTDFEWQPYHKVR